MGVAATRIESEARTARSRPRLRLVSAPPPGPRSTARSARALEARARAIFWSFAVVLVVTCVLGGARVALIVKATEMSMSEGRLQADIKQQRVEVDQLEVDRSSLSTPSRIGSIASTTMGMAPPRSVKYVDLAAGAATPTPTPGASGPIGASVGASAGTSGLGTLVAAVMDMSAGEAQSLLVGELGLAGSR